MKILGREPALWLALIGSGVALLSAYVLHLTADQQGAVNGAAALVVGVLTAWSTHDGLSAAILGLIKGAVMVALAWHLNISAENQALIYAFASAVIAMFVRTQATPRVLPGPAGLPRR